MYSYDKVGPKGDDKPKDPNSNTEKAKTYGKSGISAVGMHSTNPYTQLATYSCE